MRARRLHIPPLLACLLLFSACIEDRLNVDITTHVFADGTCSRRVEYRLVRVDSADDKPLEILPAEDPLRLLHRFPSGEPWTVKDEVRADRHTIEVEATLASPDAIEGDYWRSGRGHGAPARNAVSFAREDGDPDAGYAYTETFRDPASPLEGMRALARELLRRDEDFAERLLRQLGSSPLQKGEVKRAYRRSFAEPFGREVASLAERPIWGPRERKQLEDLWERFDALEKELASALSLLSPGAIPAETFTAGLDAVEEELGKELQRELEQAGLPLLSEKDSASRIHFRATLILPGTIVRANTCAEGDTATWDFDQEDLYGRGFEMWARSVSR